MAERKVLTKYYPPDFDPASLTARRKPKKDAGPRVQTVRLMAPFSMRCTKCGEYIYRGRKFNSRKVTPPDERYLGIQIYFFHIKCTRCSCEITFRTDPRNGDYAVVSGAVRNVEPWHARQDTTQTDETEDQHLERLEREEAEALDAAEKADRATGGASLNGNRINTCGAGATSGVDAMADLEAKNAEAKREMEAADAIDALRHRNARILLAEKQALDHDGHPAAAGRTVEDLALQAQRDAQARQDREDEEAARQAFSAARGESLSLLDRLQEEIIDEVDTFDDVTDSSPSSIPPNTVASTSTTTTTSSASSTSPHPVSEFDSTTMTSLPSLPEDHTSASQESRPGRSVLAPVDPVPSFKRTVKKKKDRAALLGIKKKPSLL